MFSKNVYYHPEEHDLVLVSEFDAGERYEFDITVVWHEAGVGYYIGTDSGCSCPTPFENYDGKADLTGPLTKVQVLEEVKNLNEDHQEEQDFGEFINEIFNF